MMLLNEDESSSSSGSESVSVSKSQKNKKKEKKIFKKKFEKKKFFTDYNSKLKCSCYKTQCDKKYCECFNNNRYCINCNCQNCLNKVPSNSTNDIKPKIITSLNPKKKKIFCTCTKSGCKLKYCECYKNGKECNDLCRCSVCENTKIKKILGNKNFFDTKICYANSIYVIDNVLKQDLKRNHFKKCFLNKKRKNQEFIKENNDINNNEIKNDDNNDEGKNKLFDKNGNIIFTHVSLNEIKKSHHFNF